MKMLPVIQAASPVPHEPAGSLSASLPRIQTSIVKSPTPMLALVLPFSGILTRST
jgi:hypothetical protein